MNNPPAANAIYLFPTTTRRRSALATRPESGVSRSGCTIRWWPTCLRTLPLRRLTLRRKRNEEGARMGFPLAPKAIRRGRGCCYRLHGLRWPPSLRARGEGSTTGGHVHVVFVWMVVRHAGGPPHSLCLSCPRLRSTGVTWCGFWMKNPRGVSHHHREVSPACLSCVQV